MTFDFLLVNELGIESTESFKVPIDKETTAEVGIAA